MLLCQFVFQQGVDVNYLSNEGKSGLCCAIENRHWETFNFLIDNHADIHWVDKDGYNLFLIALDYKRLDMAKILMQKGVNVFHQTQHGKNALCCLGTLCDLTFTQELIDKGLDYTHVNVNGLNLLHHSASCNQIEAFKFYCEKGLNPYLTENKGYNAFYYFNGARLNNPNYELAIEWYKTLLEKEKLNQALKESEIKSSQKIKI